MELTQRASKSPDIIRRDFQADSEKVSFAGKAIELVTHHEISSTRRMKHILSGYRKDLNGAECLKTVFTLHNETVNVWTHLIGFFFFVVLSMWTYVTFLAEKDFIHQLIFSVFWLATINCFLSSTVYHIFLGHCDEHIMERVTRLDYSGISALILASFFPPIFYSFYCAPEHQMLYLGGITLLGSAGVIGPQFSFYHHEKFTPIRVLLLAGSAASGFVPAVHAAYLPQNVIPIGANVLSVDEIYVRIYFMYAMYGLGLLFYLSGFPECISPGKFDIWFHSHQLWHVFVFLGALSHFLNCLNMYDKWAFDYPGGVCVHLPTATALEFQQI